MKDSMKITVKYQFVYMLLMQVAASGVVICVRIGCVLVLPVNEYCQGNNFCYIHRCKFCNAVYTWKNFAIRDNKSYTPLKPSKLKGAMFGVLISVVTDDFDGTFAFVWGKVQ